MATMKRCIMDTYKAKELNDMTFTRLDQEDNVRALAYHLQVKYSEAQELIDSEEYKVYTEEDAKDEAGREIENSLWAFNQNFIMDYSKVACAIPSETWDKMVSELCENFNEAVMAMLVAEDNLSDFIEDAISSDGLGHFLNTYDGSAEEVESNGKFKLDDTYVICQIN